MTRSHIVIFPCRGSKFTTIQQEKIRGELRACNNRTSVLLDPLSAIPWMYCLYETLWQRRSPSVAKDQSNHKYESGKPLT